MKNLFVVVAILVATVNYAQAGHDVIRERAITTTKALLTSARGTAGIALDQSQKRQNADQIIPSVKFQRYATQLVRLTSQTQRKLLLPLIQGLSKEQLHARYDEVHLQVHEVVSVFNELPEITPSDDGRLTRLLAIFDKIKQHLDKLQS